MCLEPERAVKIETEGLETRCEGKMTSDVKRCLGGGEYHQRVTSHRSPLYRGWHLEETDPHKYWSVVGVEGGRGESAR